MRAAQRLLEEAWNETALTSVLGELGEALSASSACLARIVEDASGSVRATKVARWGGMGSTGGGLALEEHEGPWGTQWHSEWSERLRSGNEVRIATQHMPLPLRQWYDRHAIGSVLMVPVNEGEAWWGVLAYASCEADRRWDTVEIESIHQLAKLLQGARARVQRESDIARTAVRYQQLFELSPCGMLLATEDGTIVEVNTAWCAIFGYAREEVIGRHVRMMVARGSEQEVEANLTRLARGEELHHVVENVRKDGQRVAIELHERIVQVGDDQRLLLVIANDVTERLRMLTMLQENEKRFRLIFESSTFGIATMELEPQRLMEVNPALCRMLGYTARELQQLTLRDITHPEDWEKEMAMGKAVREGRETCFTIRKRYVRRDGNTFWGQLTGTIVKDAEGRPLYGLGIVEDITTRMAQEEELLRRQKLESLGVLAGGIAHDFNNILTVILGNASLVREMLAGREEECRRILGEIERAAGRARQLTQQLLTFAKGGAPVKQLASLNEIITESALFATRGSSCSCKFEIAEDLWPVEVDAGQMSQVFQNLVLNAVQAMPRGGVVVIRAFNYRRKEASDAGSTHWVRIDVSDTGVGIPDANMSRIFDPYFTTKEGGSGLGLTTALSIVTKHGGRMEVCRNTGPGMTFTVLLPAHAETTAKVRKVAEKRGRLPHGLRGRVLVLDDEEPVRLLMQRTLEEVGYAVSAVGTSEEAVREFRARVGTRECFDLVILDLTLCGGGSGVEVLQALRRLDPTIKAIVTAGYSPDAVATKVGREGFDGMLPKPFRVEDFCEEVQRVLESGRRRDEGTTKE